MTEWSHELKHDGGLKHSYRWSKWLPNPGYQPVADHVRVQLWIEEDELNTCDVGVPATFWLWNDCYAHYYRYNLDDVFQQPNKHDPLVKAASKQSHEQFEEAYQAMADDPVNHPCHYTQGSIECIDAIRAALTDEEFRGFCKGNALKYLHRERHKGGDESLEKAMWYIKRALNDSE